MNGLIGRRTASDIPGLDIAEQKSWDNYLAAAIHVYAVLNGQLVEAHSLSLSDLKLLQVLGDSNTGSARMGDLAVAMHCAPARVTRKISRLESKGFVQRGVSPDDRRGVTATITDSGLVAVDRAMATYAREVRRVFLSRMSQAQVTAMEGRCRRIIEALKESGESTTVFHLPHQRPRHPGPHIG